MFSQGLEFWTGAPQGSILRALLFLITINELAQSSETGSYLYAVDLYIFFQDKHVHKIEDVLSKKFFTHCK